MSDNPITATGLMKLVTRKNVIGKLTKNTWQTVGIFVGHAEWKYSHTPIKINLK